MNSLFAKKKYCIFFLFLFSFSFSFGQTNKDSLLLEFKAAMHNNSKKNEIIKTSKNLSDSNLEIALQFGQQCLIISKKIGSKYGIAKSLLYIGNIYSNNGEYKKALSCFRESEKIFMEIKDPNGIIESWIYIAGGYSDQQKYLQSTKYNFIALKIIEKYNDREQMADCYNSIGVIYDNSGNSSLGEKYYKKALLISSTLKDSVNIVYSLNNLSTCIKNNSTKLRYLQEALKLGQKIGNKENISQSYKSIGTLFTEQRNYTLAIEYYKKSLKIDEDRKDKYDLSQDLNCLASSYYYLNQLNDAINYSLEALKYSKEINAIDIAQSAAGTLADCYSEKKDYKLAFEYNKIYQEMSDSLYNVNSSKQIQEMEAKYQNEKNVNEITLLNKDNELQILKIKRKNFTIYSVIVGLLMALTLLIILIYGYKKIQEANKLLKEQNTIIEKQKENLADEKMKSDNILLRILPEEVIQEIKTNGKVTVKHYEMLSELFTNIQREKLHSQFEALKNQLNPHFLFNSLNVLSTLVHTDADLSEEFIDKLAKTYRYLLEQKDKELIRLKTEIEFLNSYAFLMKIRFEDKIKIEINVDEEKQQYYIPPLTLQLLVENAIKHNIISKETPLVIELLTDNNNNLLIRNNFQPYENKINIYSTGIGLKNIISRYSFYTDKIVEHELKDNFFVVKIPLIKFTEENTL